VNKRLFFVLLVGAGALLLLLSRGKRSVQLSDVPIPIVSGSGFSWVSSKNGAANIGIVISNAAVVYDTAQLPKLAPCLLFRPEDLLVREMLVNEAEQLRTNRERPNIPSFFMRREKIEVYAVRPNSNIHVQATLRVQNVKLLVQ
jgi:hypothetical protein